MRRLAWLLPVFLIAFPGLARADRNAASSVGIRQGRHGSLGRLVFDFPTAERVASHLDGSLLTLRFDPAAPLSAVSLHVPGFQAMQAKAGIVQLQLEAGITPQIYRLGDRVVVDARRRAGSEAAAAARTAKLPSASSPSAAGNPHLAALPPAAATPASATPASTTPAAPPALAAPLATSAAAPAVPAADPATPASADPAGIGPPEVVNFDTQPGAAAFRRGDQAIIVFDTSEVPDLTGLQSAPLFAGARLLSLEDAQVISMSLPEGDSLSLSPVSGGWQITPIAAIPLPPPPPQTSVSAVEFPMQSANQSVIIADPLAGGDLLVGTVTQATDAADFVESGPGYAVLPAWLGVAIVPQADDLGLNASLKGFELASDSAHGLPLGAPPPIDAGFTPPTDLASAQSLLLPHGTTPELWQKLLADQRTAAMLPELGRLSAQIALAGDMLALGMGPEAEGVLGTAVLENPAALDNGRIAAMRAVAGVISHRGQDADFTSPGLHPGVELAFWRAVGGLDQGRTGQNTAALIAGLRPFETCPVPLRDTVGAEIAEALVDAGDLPAAMQLVASDPGNSIYDLARAKIMEARNAPLIALQAYQNLVHDQDFRAAALANARVVELQLAAGQLNDAQAADALDAQLFDWRAPEHERHLRLRIAALRAAAGQWPQAFNMLASAAQLFPDRQSAIGAIRAAMFLKMLKSRAITEMSPIEAVAILQQNQDLIPSGSGSLQVMNLLAQHLEALGLPGAAAPVLTRLIQSLPQGDARAILGATLAQVDLDAGSPVAALADLAQTQADGLPPELTAQRGVLAAKAQAAGGDAVAAVVALTPAASPPSPPTAGIGKLVPLPPAPDRRTLAARAQIAEQSGQWPQAEQALGALVAAWPPGSGAIDGTAEGLLLRLATAASHTGDTAMLASLAANYGSRVGNDAAGRMFRTLTAPPLTGDQGLSQALHEIAELQALPAMVDAVADNAPPDAAKP